MNRERWLCSLAWVITALGAALLFLWWWSQKRRTVDRPAQRIELDISFQDEEEVAAEPETDDAASESQEALLAQELGGEPDDLTQIEGIGPKISAVLIASGITTFSRLAAVDVQILKQMLREGGIRIAYPETWPEQAELAAQNRWEDLDTLQGELVRGRRI